MRRVGERPFRLDSPRPTLPFKDYAYNELRYRGLASTDPKAAEALIARAQQVVTEKYRQYEELARRGGECFHPKCTHVEPDGAEETARTPERSDGPHNELHGSPAAQPADRLGLAPHR
jgi:hypothetical protein